jgi:hypothetical protein
MTTALATPDLGPKKLDLAEGQYRPFTAGRVTVTVQCVRFDEAYTVVVEQGTYRVEDQCGSYPTEQMACTIARGYAILALAEVTA